MRSIVALVFCCIPAASFAESIHAYKSVHTDGSVTYSDTRPAAASSIETVSIPATDAAIIEQGRRRSNEMGSTARQLEEQRSQQAEARRKYESRLARARQEVRDAQRYLATTRESKKHASPQRIGHAEERLELARKRLREVEQAGP